MHFWSVQTPCFSFQAPTFVKDGAFDILAALCLVFLIYKMRAIIITELIATIIG